MNPVLKTVTSKDNREDKGITKGELKSLMPKACVTALADFMKLANHVLHDGSVTYGEYIRLMNQMRVTHTKMIESKRLRDLVKKGQTLSGKKPSLEKSLTDNLGVPDLEF